jgi:hypothetical protein
MPFQGLESSGNGGIPPFGYREQKQKMGHLTDRLKGPQKIVHGKFCVPIWMGVFEGENPLEGIFSHCTSQGISSAE